MAKEDKKSDWIKWVAIILAILFFIMWILNIASNSYEIQQMKDYENKIKDLHNKWTYAYNTLNNCYKNNMPSCEVDIPYLRD